MVGLKKVRDSKCWVAPWKGDEWNHRRENEKSRGRRLWEAGWRKEGAVKGLGG